MPDRPRIPAVVTAMNLNGLGVARTLGRAGVPVIGVHGADPGCEVRSRYLTECWTRGPTDAELLELLLAKGPGFGERPVLLPITDESVILVADHLAELRRFYRIAMPAPEVVHELLDKEGIREAAARHGCLVPRTWSIADGEQFERAVAEIVFPCILKPSSKEAAWPKAGLRKAYVLEDREALLRLWQEVAVVSQRVVIQQYVPGGDENVYFTLLYCKEGGAAASVFSGRKLRQWRPHCGGTSSCEPVDESRLDQAARDFFTAVGMHGLCSLEYKRDPRDGSYYMIEPTVCRPDWQNGVADANGVPLSYLAYCDLAGIEMPAPRRRGIARRWVYLPWDRQSAAYYRSRGELGFFSWLWSIRPPVRGAVFALDDLGPWLATVGDARRRAWAKVKRLFGGRGEEGAA